MTTSYFDPQVSEPKTTIIPSVPVVCFDLLSGGYKDATTRRNHNTFLIAAIGVLLLLLLGYGILEQRSASANRSKISADTQQRSTLLANLGHLYGTTGASPQVLAGYLNTVSNQITAALSTEPEQATILSGLYGINVSGLTITSVSIGNLPSPTNKTSATATTAPSSSSASGTTSTATTNTVNISATVSGYSGVAAWEQAIAALPYFAPNATTTFTGTASQVTITTKATLNSQAVTSLASQYKNQLKVPTGLAGIP